MNKMYFFCTILMLGSMAWVDGQGLKTCLQNEECIALSKCEPLLQLVRSGDRTKIAQLRKEICGFLVRTSKVCCPTSSKSTDPVTKTPFEIGNEVNKENLLPKDPKCGHPISDDKVIGGEPAPMGAYPWVCALAYKERGSTVLKFDCGCSLINNRYILTAAHCLSKKYLGRRTLESIHLGDYHLKNKTDCTRSTFGITRCSPDPVVVTPEEIIVHESFDQGQRFANDIGLVRIDRYLPIGQRGFNAFVVPVCLPKVGFTSRSIAGNIEPLAVGWGFTEDNTQSDILLRVSLPVADNAMCERRYGAQFVKDFQLCVGGGKGKDTCSGDSGGPLVVPGTFGPPFIQIGVVSYGPFPCAQDGTPGVYSDTASYRQWIVDHLKP